MSDRCLVHAYPPFREHLHGLWVYPLAAFLFTAISVVALDKGTGILAPPGSSFNLVLIGSVFLVSLAAVVTWSTRTNRRWRHFRVYEDRITFGANEDEVLPFSNLTRIRVGTPVPASLSPLLKVNDTLGKVATDNRQASENLRATYRATVVLDTATSSRVFQVGTVQNGLELLQLLVDRNRGLLADPTYTAEELKRFGRFKPGSYASP